MNNIRPLLRLTTITVFLTVGLFAFTLVNKGKFQEPEILGCGTVNMSNDAGFNPPLEHAGLKIFQDNCKACHRLDNKLIGPALRYSFEVRDSIWFVKMIVSANGLINSGDTLAVRLFNDYNQIQHPDFKGLNKKELADLVEYLKLEGEREITVY